MKLHWDDRIIRDCISQYLATHSCAIRVCMQCSVLQYACMFITKFTAGSSVWRNHSKVQDTLHPSAQNWRLCPGIVVQYQNTWNVISLHQQSCFDFSIMVLSLLPVLSRPAVASGAVIQPIRLQSITCKKLLKQLYLSLFFIIWHHLMTN